MKTPNRQRPSIFCVYHTAWTLFAVLLAGTSTRAQSAPAERMPPPPSPMTQTLRSDMAAMGAQGCGELTPTTRSQLCPRCGVDSAGQCCCDNGRWRNSVPIEFDSFGQGEYVGPHRLQHVPRYRIRVDDRLELVYRLTREVIGKDYEFNVGDQLQIEGDALDENIGPNFDRQLVVLPDGTITLPLVGQVRAAGRTVQQLRSEIEERGKKWYKFAVWTVTPLLVDTRVADLRNSVDARAGNGGQSITLRVTPDGTIQPPALGSVCVQGLTLEELKYEIDERYVEADFRGIEVSPVLAERAATFVYVLGEVTTPGRFTLERPTTVTQAIALAGGWNIGGNLRQIVVFRRASDWRLVATKLCLQGSLMGNRPTPADEIFLRDSDIVLVPKSPIRRIDDAISLIFTQGANEVALFGARIGFFNLTRF